MTDTSKLSPLSKAGGRNWLWELHPREGQTRVEYEDTPSGLAVRYQRPEPRVAELEHAMGVPDMFFATLEDVGYVDAESPPLTRFGVFGEVLA